MITFYFDCFSGVSGEKILGSLIDCVGSFDLSDALNNVSGGEVELKNSNTLAGGIPGVRAEIVSSDEVFFPDDTEIDVEYKKVYELSKEILFMAESLTKKEFYTLFSVLYILSKTEYDTVITSPVYDGMGDGTRGNTPDKEVISYMERCGIDMVITDSPFFVSDRLGAIILSAVTQSCSSIPEGDIVKIGYGLGYDADDVTDALRLVILSQRERDAVDVFEAALEFPKDCALTTAYSNKGKID